MDTLGRYDPQLTASKRGGPALSCSTMPPGKSRADDRQATRKTRIAKDARRSAQTQ